MSDKYIYFKLVKDKPIPCSFLDANIGMKMHLDYIEGKHGTITILSVFTGINRALAEEQPMLFETSVSWPVHYDGQSDKKQQYSNRAACLEGHNKHLVEVSKTLDRLEPVVEDK